MKNKAIKTYLFTIGLMFNLSAYAAEMPTQEEMWQMIQSQQKQIEMLKALVMENQEKVTHAQAKADETKNEMNEILALSSTTQTELGQAKAQIEATSLAVEDIHNNSSSGLGWWDKTSVGGYGELHASFYDNAADTIDFHRFVLFVNHEYNDWITLYTEFEIEHSIAGESKNGEVEIEQAFVRLDWTDQFSTDVGLFLMPIGITNETHEPNTFYGVERNNVESRIIPSTWWEAGVKGQYRLNNGLSFEAGLVSGLDMGTSGVIRGGRQKVSEAINTEASFVGRIKYTGIPGLELGASAFHQNDVAQSVAAKVSALLTSVHLDYQRNAFRFKALYARWDLDGTTDPDAEEQYGYYFEPSYRINLSDRFGDLGVYFRYSNYEYYTGSVISDNEIYELGINYWPTDNVVLKADIQDISESDQYSSKGDKAINLGVGYQF